MCPSPDGKAAAGRVPAPDRPGAPLQFHPPMTDEDRARAGYYALLARLFYAGPDAALLDAIAVADEIVAESAGSALAGAWSALLTAARAMDADAASLEYDEVFVGTGKAEVTPYASYYLSETGREKIIVRVRQELAAMGLSRAEAAREPEDHFAGLFEVMRHLITDADDAALQKQKRFFDHFIARSYPVFCDAISKASKTNFYRHVGDFARVFLDIESESLKVF
jgi:TorA maturation chaperone TorD